MVLINLKLVLDCKIQLENINNFINSQEIHNTNTLATFSKTYERQAVCGCYVHELIHRRTLYKEIKDIYNWASLGRKEITRPSSESTCVLRNVLEFL